MSIIKVDYGNIGGGVLTSEFITLDAGYTQSLKTINNLVVGKEYIITTLMSWGNSGYPTGAYISTFNSGMDDVTTIDEKNYKNASSGNGSYQSCGIYKFKATDTTISYTVNRPEANYCILTYIE